MFAVFYGSSLLALTMKVINEGVDFWNHFNDILRLIICQPINTQSLRRMRGLFLFYIFNQTLGFIIVVWYSAILGSFLTTYIYGKTICSFVDIRAANLKILFPKLDFNILTNFEGIKDNLDLFEMTDITKMNHLRNHLDIGYAYVTLNDHWNHFALPQMRFYNDERFKATKILLAKGIAFMNINHDSVYKARLNRYIHIIKDVGLFQLWCEKVFMENLKHSVSMQLMTKSKDNVVKVLEIGYFEYLFIGWSVGLAFSCLVFVCEVYV